MRLVNSLTFQYQVQLGVHFLLKKGKKATDRSVTAFTVTEQGINISPLVSARGDHQCHS